MLKKYLLSKKMPRLEDVMRGYKGCILLVFYVRWSAIKILIFTKFQTEIPRVGEKCSLIFTNFTLECPRCQIDKIIGRLYSINFHCRKNVFVFFKNQQQRSDLLSGFENDCWRRNEIHIHVLFLLFFFSSFFVFIMIECVARRRWFIGEYRICQVKENGSLTESTTGTRLSSVTEKR